MAKGTKPMEGILLIHKPEGFTSFDVIAKMRGILGTRRIGHSGTLDPMATGVLTLFIGRATKTISLIPPRAKRYIGKVKLGLLTDTLDRTGVTLESIERPVTQEELVLVLQQFIGKIKQIPPMYSAVKIEGKKLYQLARAGKTVERKPRNIEIYNIQLLEVQEDTGTFTIDVLCEKGTYIRTLASDIGTALTSFGCLMDLQRISSDGFDLQDCYTLEEVEKRKKTEGLEGLLKPVEEVFDFAPKVSLPLDKTLEYLNGIKILPPPEQGLKEGDVVRLYDQNNVFVGLAMICHEGYLKSKCLYVERGDYEKSQ